MVIIFYRHVAPNGRWTRPKSTFLPISSAISLLLHCKAQVITALSAQISYNEKELLIQVANGDESAFKKLFLQWYQLLAGYIFRITESRELTEEIVQDTFLKIWMSRESLVEINHFKHYLLVVSRNKAFDALKKRLKEQQLQKSWEKEIRTELHNADNEDSAISLIDEAIESLPPRRKEVYLLSRHERLSYKEIAQRLGISTESVKTHLRLATESITEFIRSRLPGIGMIIAFFSKII